jgi:small subunit ribosomal protein S6
MFLLDNQVVREDWRAAKKVVTDALAKHGATVVTARRWDERKLAYPIRGKRRGTYFIVWYVSVGAQMPALRREFDLSEKVLRYMILSSEGVPEGERELAEAENAADYTVPAPPPDDAVEEEVEATPAEGSAPAEEPVLDEEVPAAEEEE